MKYLLAITLTTTLATGCGELDFQAARLKYNWSSSTVSEVRDSMTGQADSSLLGNYQAISFDTDKLEMILKLPAPNLFKNWEEAVSKLPGVSLKSTVDSQDKSILELRFPIKYAVTQFEKGFGSKLGLPNGQEIPGVPGGKMFVEKIKIDKDHTAHVFFDKGKVALLLTVPFDPMIVTTIPIKKKAHSNAADNIIGFAHTIPKRSGEAGGLLVTAFIPEALLKKLEQE